MRRPPPLALAYHGVGVVALDDDPARLFCSPAQVDADVRALLGWGYELVTFGELAARAARGTAAGAAALTFDDAIAGPFPAVPLTVFAVTGWLGGRHPDAPGARVLGAEELRALHARGAEIGAHTVAHPDLTRLAAAEAEAELAGSRAALEDLLQAPVLSAAYPFGAADDAVRAAARRAGLHAACRTAGAGRWDDPFDLPRQAMGPAGTRLGLRLKRAGVHEPLMRLPLARRLRGANRRRRARPR